MIKIEVDGVTYSGFVSAEVTRRMDSIASTFSFNATSRGDSYMPFVGGEDCRIFVDGELVLTGSIEVVEAEYSADSHDITIIGRSLTADLVDSTLDSMPAISGEGLTVKGLAETVIDSIGASLVVDDIANPAPFNKAEDVSSPQVGEGAFEFLERYTRKRQVLLSDNPDGGVVIGKSTGDTIGARLQHIINSDGNNVLGATVSYDRTGRYNVHRFSSALNVGAINSAGSVSIDDITSQLSTVVVDDDVPAGRQLVQVSETSASSEQNTERAKWERNIRRARGRIYTARVSGYRNQTGALWNTNTVISVIDDHAAINGQMLVNSVTYTHDLNSGSETALTLLPPDAYSLDIQQPVQGDTGAQLFA